jgi:ergothioneine biosynthesis protein EgtB
MMSSHTSAQRYEEVRAFTERISAPLGPEDQTVQSMPDVSPTKWHRAHVTWFFETFVLTPNVAGYRPFDEDFAYLFNSYYESVGPRHSRVARGHITRPTADRVTEYRRHVDAAMVDVLRGPVPPSVADLVELGLHHEQQHQELLLMDIKHVLSVNPTSPAYREPGVDSPTGHGPASPIGWMEIEGGPSCIGYDLADFSYDNESPAHTVWLEPFRLADRPVTCGEWIQFIDDGGYRRPEFWLSDGWATINEEEIDAPLYWSRCDDRSPWRIFTLEGERDVHADEPVCHVSHYEADAYARWAGARLPTEAEWEVAVTTAKIEPGIDDNLAPLGHLHPVPAVEIGSGDPPLRQVFGDVWEWTASPYVPYPGFAPAPGAVGEYNGKFMSNQMVLRGGCAVTPGDHVRVTYRNFFPPRARWQFAGLRLATDQ